MIGGAVTLDAKQIFARFRGEQHTKIDSEVRNSGLGMHLIAGLAYHVSDGVFKLDFQNLHWARGRHLPPDLGERQIAAVAPNVLNRSFDATANGLRTSPTCGRRRTGSTSLR